MSRKFKFHRNLTRITDTSHEDVCTFMITSRSILLRMRNVSDKIVEKIKTHVLCSIIYFLKLRRLRDNVDKYCRAVQDTDDNMAHAHCMLDTSVYRYTLRIRNTYCFSTTTMVERTRLIVTSHTNCLYCVHHRYKATNTAQAQYRATVAAGGAISKMAIKRNTVYNAISISRFLWALR